MRHHGLPTRLLDWSESVLVAAYFAVEQKPSGKEYPPILWALSSIGLNQSQGVGGWINMTDPHGRALIAPVFGEKPDAKLKGKVLAAYAPQYRLRMMLQQSVFTIHGTGTPLEKLDGAEGFLRGYVIDPHARDELLRELDLLGIRRSTLFPDLDNLAMDVECMVGDY